MLARNFRYFAKTFFNVDLTQQQIDIIMYFNTYKRDEILIDRESQEWKLSEFVGDDGKGAPTHAVLTKGGHNRAGTMEVKVMVHRIEELDRYYHRKTSRCNCSCGACH